MLQSIRLRLGQARVMRPWLRRAYGRRWPLALVRGLVGANRLVRRTRWADRRDPEAAFVRALALLPAVVSDLRERAGHDAAEAARELTEAVLGAQHERSAREAGLGQISDGRERWHAYFDRALPHGVHAFDEADCLALEPDRLHVRVFRCVLAELAQAAGIQDLLRTACARSSSFYQGLLPSHEFQQSGPVRNALAGGESFCDYVWERRQRQPAEASPARRAETQAAPEAAGGDETTGAC